MSWYLIIRFLHIGSAMLFIGGVVARQIIRVQANRTNDIRAFVTLSQAGGQIENAMVMPGSIGVIVFGVFLTLITRTPAGGFLQGAPQNWLLASLLLLLLDFLTVPVVNMQRGKHFDQVLKEAIATSKMTPQLRAELANTRIRWMYCMQLTVPVVIVILMVFKPF